MKKNLLLLATMFYISAAFATPILGFALLEPSGENLFIISMLFTLSVLGSFFYCDLWIKEKKWNNDIKKAFKQLERERMRTMFKQLDEQSN